MLRESNAFKLNTHIFLELEVCNLIQSLIRVEVGLAGSLVPFYVRRVPLPQVCQENDEEMVSGVSPGHDQQMVKKWSRGTLEWHSENGKQVVTKVVPAKAGTI